jgi:hypothetical protein
MCLPAGYIFKACTSAMAHVSLEQVSVSGFCFTMEHKYQYKYIKIIFTDFFFWIPNEGFISLYLLHWNTVESNFTLLKGLSKNGVNCGKMQIAGNGLQYMKNLGKLKGPEKCCKWW